MAHTWKFARVGGFDQVQLGSGKDLLALRELDQKLWVALACPTKGIEFDERTLALVDTDKDGRVRAGELIAACEWAGSMLRDAESLAKGSASLTIGSIKEDSDEGKLIAATAKRILSSLGKADAKEITVDDLKDATSSFEKQALNGDGVIHPGSTEDESLKATITDAVACTATPPKDKSGADGLDEAAVNAFFDAIAEHAAWLDKAKSDDALRPLGDGTAAAHGAYAAVKAKIDDYFARVRVAAYDPRALTAVNGEEKAYLEIAAKDLNISADEVAHLPVAQIAADKPLSLTKGVNPAWSGKVAELVEKALKPMGLDKPALAETDWLTVKAKLEPFGAYLADKKGATVEKLGAERVAALAKGDAKAKLLALCADDKALEPEAKAIENVEKLVRFHRDLLELANNFVSFRGFYSRKKPAIFQVGTLFLDQRACELCVDVTDAGRHGSMAAGANMYLVYCNLKNAKGETKAIAAMMSNGDVDNLMVGRNGIFYDRKGGDWDATITKIVENPISIRQAFWTPYKKALRMIEGFISSRAAAADAEADAKLTANVDAGTTAVAAGNAPAAPPAPPARPMDVGMIAAMGVAVGGITAALGALLQAFFGLGIWMPLGVLGLMLLISGPAMAVAWLKLRKRNLGPLLDANGWAVNAMAKVNVPFGESLTKTAALPANASRSLEDPFEEKKSPWGTYVTILVVLALAALWYLGKLDGYLPTGARSVSVLGPSAPAYVAPAAAPEAPPAS